MEPPSRVPASEFSVVQPVKTGIYKGLEVRFDIINLFDEVYQIRFGTGLACLPRNSVRAALSLPA